MAKEIRKQKIIVVGAGPVGALAAQYAAQRGHDVEVYELRNLMIFCFFIPSYIN
jgi:kynurenine 3-monooxygenase